MVRARGLAPGTNVTDAGAQEQAQEEEGSTIALAGNAMKQEHTRLASLVNAVSTRPSDSAISMAGCIH